MLNWENDGKEGKDYAVSLYNCVTRTIKNIPYFFKETITATFTFNSIKCGIIDSFTPSNYTLAMLINTKHYGSIAEYSVCKPVEILTTDELVEIFENK